jgi:oligosaccharyltransferase complex subunit beta
MRSSAIALLVLLGSSLYLSVAAEKKVLVLFGQSSIKESHGQFIKGLESKGVTVDLKSVKDSSLKLKNYDTWLYDALVLFAPKATSECRNKPQADHHRSAAAVTANRS